MFIYLLRFFYLDIKALTFVLYFFVTDALLRCREVKKLMQAQLWKNRHTVYFLKQLHVLRKAYCYDIVKHLLGQK